MADRMTTSSITSRDREEWRSWSQYLSCPLFRYFENGSRYSVTTGHL